MLKKTIALVVSLTKLHNYCIDEVDIATEATIRDRFTNQNNGCVRMIFSDDAKMDLPEGLLYGSHHRDDMLSNSLCTHSNQPNDEIFPCEILLAQIGAKNLKQPTPKRHCH
jgi:hypothetical protein